MTGIVNNTGAKSGIIGGITGKGTWQGTAIADEYGGTGQSTYAQGDILYGYNTNDLRKLVKGSDNQTLMMNGNVPNWETVTASTPTFGGCRVTLSSSQNISSSGVTKVTWDSEIHDTLGEFASNKYTATVAGIYLLTTTLLYVDMGDLKDMVTHIYVNNTSIARTDHKSSSANYESTIPVTTIVSLSVTNYVEVFAAHAHSPNRDLSPGAENSWFCVQRLS